jgi:hypothetical protein
MAVGCAVSLVEVVGDGLCFGRGWVFGMASGAAVFAAAMASFGILFHVRSATFTTGTGRFGFLFFAATAPVGITRFVVLCAPALLSSRSPLLLFFHSKEFSLGLSVSTLQLSPLISLLLVDNGTLFLSLFFPPTLCSGLSLLEVSTGSFFFGVTSGTTLSTSCFPFGILDVGTGTGTTDSIRFTSARRMLYVTTFMA